jgi:hypothetical protein
MQLPGAHPAPFTKVLAARPCCAHAAWCTRPTPGSQTHAAISNARYPEGVPPYFVDYLEDPPDTAGGGLFRSPLECAGPSQAGTPRVRITNACSFRQRRRVTLVQPTSRRLGLVWCQRSW